MNQKRSKEKLKNSMRYYLIVIVNIVCRKKKVTGERGILLLYRNLRMESAEW